jgi:hypothetical protein
MPKKQPCNNENRQININRFLYMFIWGISFKAKSTPASENFEGKEFLKNGYIDSLFIVLRIIPEKQTPQV